jgi:predicted RNA-binding protein with PIN domain
VDGHSVIFAWPELERLHRANPSKARQILVQRLEDLSDAGSWRVTVVFDGARPSRSLGSSSEGVEVWYAGHGESADSVIEAMVAGSNSPSELVVITADRGERCTVEGLGAFCFSPDWLKMEWENACQTLRELLHQVHRRARWTQRWE